MDVPGSAGPVDIMKAMELDKIENKSWHITSRLAGACYFLVRPALSLGPVVYVRPLLTLTPSFFLPFSLSFPFAVTFQPTNPTLSNALTGTGIDEGIDWLAEKLQENREQYRNGRRK